MRKNIEHQNKTVKLNTRVLFNNTFPEEPKRGDGLCLNAMYQAPSRHFKRVISLHAHKKRLKYYWQLCSSNKGETPLVLVMTVIVVIFV